MSQLIELVERALAFHALSISDLIALFEDERPQAAAQRRAALSLLGAHPHRRDACLVGITGTPGSGKSSLLGALVPSLSGADRLAIAVVAVDPSSPISGGALLGDRVRVRFPPERPELYFRSQASQSALGGLAPRTFPVCQLLRLLFDVVFIETVGVGQSELDVRGVVDRLYLVLQPMGGDEVQLLKAGLLEVPDAIVLNKCDEGEAAERLHATISTTLPLSRPLGPPPPVLRTSARTGEGIAALASDIMRAVKSPRADFGLKAARYFERWVTVEWGRAGARLLRDRLGGAMAFLVASGDLDAAQSAFHGQMGVPVA